MRFEEKLQKTSPQKLWNEYCGFLDLSMDEYMAIQSRLLEEQISLMSKCTLGRRLMKGEIPANMEEFRRMVPLTSYADYADTLLIRSAEQLPLPPVLWLETTWEGGPGPMKAAPYTEAMLEVYKNNIFAAMMLSTATEKYKFKVRPNAKVLFALAPLPYATGLYPELMNKELRVNFLPPYEKIKNLSFSQKTKEGFRLALKHGMDQFYGMSSILYNMSKNFDISSGKSSIGALFNMSPVMIYRLLRAKYFSKRDGTPIRPADLFRLEGFVCVGTDSSLYKDELEQFWGCRPLEIAGGTEPGCLGTETWKKDGLVFFPDNGFYEFIPENEMKKSLADPKYIPKTYLMNELVAGERYELVFTSFKGGAFLRYRIGDVYRCLRLNNRQDGLDFPQFEYVDRIPTVIDIAGFTRITRKEIDDVISMAHLPVANWFAVKEYDSDNHSFLHFYAELKEDCIISGAACSDLIREHMSIYFRFFDSDYKDLKRLIGVDPLQITILPAGSITGYEKELGRQLPKINPARQNVVDLLRMSGIPTPEGGAGLW